MAVSVLAASLLPLTAVFGTWPRALAGGAARKVAYRDGGRAMIWLHTPGVQVGVAVIGRRHCIVGSSLPPVWAASLIP